jgi:hypothetical protein
MNNNYSNLTITLIFIIIILLLIFILQFGDHIKLLLLLLKLAIGNEKVQFESPHILFSDIVDLCKARKIVDKVKHLLILRRLSVEGNDWNTVTQLVRKGID